MTKVLSPAGTSLSTMTAPAWTFGKYSVYGSTAKGNIVLTCFFQAFYVTNDGLTVADDRPAQQCC